MTPPLWLLELEVPQAAGAVFADLLAILAEDFSAFEADGGASWRFAAYLAAPPDEAALAARCALAAAAAGVAAPAVRLGPLPQRDWLAQNRRQFPPVSAGRFFIHGSSFRGRVPPGRLALTLDAGLAFGSGTHESTRGCLLALDRLAKRRRFRAVLDLGCGSGVLALAAARLWRRPVAAVDIDPVAVRVTRENARRNGLAALLRAGRGGSAPAAGAWRGHYDLILANILARPLARLAPHLARARAPVGRLVLSGILAGQGAGVLAAYRAQGLALERRLTLSSWVTLILRRAGPRAPKLRI